MAAQLESLIDRFDDDDALWVAIIKGNGPTFSAGQDLKAARGSCARFSGALESLACGQCHAAAFIHLAVAGSELDRTGAKSWKPPAYVWLFLNLARQDWR